MNDTHIQKLSEMKTVLEQVITVQENNARLSDELFKKLRKLPQAYSFIYSEIKPGERHELVEFRLMRSVSREYVPGYGLEHFASCYKTIREIPEEQIRGTWRLYVPHFQATLSYDETIGQVPEVFLKMCKEFVVVIDELIDFCKTQEPQQNETNATN